MHFSKFPLLSRIPAKLGARLHFALACEAAFLQSDYALYFSCTWRGNTNSTHHIANTRSGYWRLALKIFFVSCFFFVFFFSVDFCQVPEIWDVSLTSWIVLILDGQWYIKVLVFVSSGTLDARQRLVWWFFSAPNVQATNITSTRQGRGVQLSQHLWNPRSWQSNNLTFLRRG